MHSSGMRSINSNEVFHAHVQRLQIAIVHANNPRPDRQRTIKFRAVCTSTSGSIFSSRPNRHQFPQRTIAQRRHNQQKTVRIVRPRFPHLPGIENEILAQHWQLDAVPAHPADSSASRRKIPARSAPTAPPLLLPPDHAPNATASNGSRSTPREGDAGFSSAITFSSTRTRKRAGKIAHRRSRRDTELQRRLRQHPLAVVHRRAARLQNPVEHRARVRLSRHLRMFVC